MKNICIVDGCGCEVVSVGKRKDSQGKPTTIYCDKHYARYKAHGTVSDNGRTHASLADRFWRKVVKKSDDDCWEWSGTILGNGYGQIRSGGKEGKKILAHRLSYELNKCEIPDGLVVMHTCDNRKCVNPNHLGLGTYKDNTQDCWQKGRGSVNVIARIGAMNGRAVVNEDDVRYIRSSNDPLKQMAERYGVSVGAIDKIRQRKTWTHIV